MSRVKELCDRIENHYKPHEDNSDILTLTKIIRLQHETLLNYAEKEKDWVSSESRQTLEETNRIASESEGGEK